MSAELTALTLAGLWLAVQFVAYAVPANRDLGPGYTLSPRDRDPSHEMSKATARLGRAFENHVEWLPLFAIGVFIIELTAQNSTHTAIFAWAYLTARVLYVPAYVLGLKPWRSLIWAVGFLASILMLLAALI